VCPCGSKGSDGQSVGTLLQSEGAERSFAPPPRFEAPPTKVSAPEPARGSLKSGLVKSERGSLKRNVTFEDDEVQEDRGAVDAGGPKEATAVADAGVVELAEVPAEISAAPEPETVVDVPTEVSPRHSKIESATSAIEPDVQPAPPPESPRACLETLREELSRVGSGQRGSGVSGNSAALASLALAVPQKEKPRSSGFLVAPHLEENKAIQAAIRSYHVKAAGGELSADALIAAVMSCKPGKHRALAVKTLQELFGLFTCNTISASLDLLDDYEDAECLIGLVVGYIEDPADFNLVLDHKVLAKMKPNKRMKYLQTTSR